MTLKSLLGILCGASLFSASAFALPKATELVADMGLGFNIGNTMEEPENPTSWGNEIPTAAYIKAIKAAGFKTVRIPCAWYSHTDAHKADIAAGGGHDTNNYRFVSTATNATNPVIDPAWLQQVKSVVDLIIAEGMYVILNSHWDEGWLEDRVFDGVGTPRAGAGNVTNSAELVKARQAAIWKQIAETFADYDEHLIFAGANEPGVNDTWGDNGQWQFDQARMTILKGYYEAFISAVRNAGGQNATRTLVVQAPRTEMDFADLLANNLPTDPAGKGYMMVEFHYYPYQYSLMTDDEDWGKVYYYYTGLESSTDKEHNMGWNVYANAIDNNALGTPNQMSSAFGKLKTQFYDQGIPIVLGEFGAMKRLNALANNADNLKLHLQGRALFYGNVAKYSKMNGIIPCAWDTGDEGNGNFTIISRRGGNYGLYDPDVMNAMRTEYGQATIQGGPSIDDVVNENKTPEGDALGAQLTYTTTARTDSSETGTLRLSGNFDLSGYVGLEVALKGTVESAGPLAGEDYGWPTFELFMMDSGWDWFDASLVDGGNLTGEYQKVRLDFADFRNDPTAVLKNIAAIGINLYGTQVSGQVVFDYIAGVKADGTTEIIEDFNQKPATEGIVSDVKIVAMSGTDKIQVQKALATNVRFTQTSGSVNVMFSSATAAQTHVSLVNSLGQIIAQKTVKATPGMNTVELQTEYRGPAFMLVKQNSQMQKARIMLK